MKELSLLFLILFLCASCSSDDTVNSSGDILFENFPSLPIPDDNPLTEPGKQLGRMLFYETKLSRTNTMSCASCHKQELAFSDDNPVSFGVDSVMGTRQSLALFNLAYSEVGFFWDGRADVLRHQSLLPIENELELDETLENVVAKLSNEQLYLDQFTLAFGNNEITEDKIGLALEQFLTSLVSKNSRYDQYKRNEINLTTSELNGELLFKERGCFNCHAGFNIGTIGNLFSNNGLDSTDDFLDFGRELVTGLESDRAKFKVTSLRNIAVTAPYMHDGRFSTLEDVINHYSFKIKESTTVDGAVIGGFDMTLSEQADLINFLETLTDEEFLANPDFSDPF